MEMVPSWRAITKGWMVVAVAASVTSPAAANPTSIEPEPSTLSGLSVPVEADSNAIDVGIHQLAFGQTPSAPEHSQFRPKVLRYKRPLRLWNNDYVLHVRAPGKRKSFIHLELRF